MTSRKNKLILKHISPKTSSKKQKNTVSPLKRNGKIKLTKHYSTIEAIQQHVSFHRDTEFRELLQYPPKGSCIILPSKSCSSC
ncbi:ShET2/EspL2 family type III secretion system effector toxin [Escherichia albertii]|nr:ShET2/EspL2 family type III secretion system effector toxin [Escherichia albertii]